jgi:carbonic anhydrase
VLGLKLGEGVVMRNIGGRITPATLRSWALLGRLGQGQPPSGHLMILHPHRLRHPPPRGLP